MKNIKIGNKIIGKGKPVYIIAEAGSNHNRRLDFAYRLIDAAAQAKVNAVKFQLFQADKLYPRKAKVAKYLAGKYSNIHSLMKNLELPPVWIPKLILYAKKRGLDFICTPFDLESADLLYKNKVAAFKIASSECNYLDLIEFIAIKNRPVIISTGLCDLSEISDTVKIFRKHNQKLILMHTIVDYPSKPEEANLPYMKLLSQKFNCCVGLSDHSLDPVILPVAMTALGGNVIEKHITLDKKLPGPDHKFALEPDQLKTMVQAIRDTEAALKSNRKKLSKNEKELIKVSKRNIHARVDIKKGEIIIADKLVILRSGVGIKSGLPPKFVKQVIGRVAKRNIPEGQGIIKSDLN